jgi:HEAT repeat protein
VPAGAAQALVVAAADSSGAVRHAAAAGLRELVAVLPRDDNPLLDALSGRLGSPDPVVRSAMLDVLAQLRTDDPAPFASALSDPDHRVRLRAVRGLASVGQDRLIAEAAGDGSREVRVAVAEGLASLPAGPVVTDAVGRLADDRDPLVQAAAFKAAGALGCPPPLDVLAAGAITAAAWQVRAGAAQALAAAGPDAAVPPLTAALSDPHADVRKAAVIALTQMEASPAVVAALRTAAADPDADVRAYARKTEGTERVG